MRGQRREKTLHPRRAQSRRGIVHFARRVIGHRRDQLPFARRVRNRLRWIHIVLWLHIGGIEFERREPLLCFLGILLANLQFDRAERRVRAQRVGVLVRQRARNPRRVENSFPER